MRNTTVHYIHYTTYSTLHTLHTLQETTSTQSTLHTVGKRQSTLHTVSESLGLVVNLKTVRAWPLTSKGELLVKGVLSLLHPLLWEIPQALTAQDLSDQVSPEIQVLSFSPLPGVTVARPGPHDSGHESTLALTTSVMGDSDHEDALAF
jgi:hypothetical protein